MARYYEKLKLVILYDTLSIRHCFVPMRVTRMLLDDVMISFPIIGIT